MNNFWVRTLSGAVYVGLVLGSLWAGWMYFVPLFALVCAVCLWEFLGQEIGKREPALILGLFGGVSLYLIGSYGILANAELTRYLPFILLIPLAILVLGLFQPSRPNFSHAATVLFAYLYIVLPLILLSMIEKRNLPGSGISPLLGVFILFWVNDTGAYLSGRLLGRHLLIPAVSPKKTIEGLIGGTVLAMLAAWLLSRYSLSFSTEQWLVCGALVAVFGTLGDLVESMWKRKLGIKDSGNIMPGHGGLMDRFDGFFIAIPAIYFYLFLQGF